MSWFGGIHSQRMLQTLKLGSRAFSAALALVFLLSPAASRSQTTQPPETQNPSTALEALVQEAGRRISERHSRPLGEVVESRRGRVFVAIRGEPPANTARLAAYRSIGTAGSERLITFLRVQRRSAGLLECREVDRVDRQHAEAGDLVRLQNSPKRVLLAPCISLVDLAPVIPQVIGEKLRTLLLGHRSFELHADLEAQEQAEAAYWSGEVSSYLNSQQNLDLVLFPVLLQTQNKLVLNLEYYSVERGRATEIDVATVELDAMLHAWLRAGTSRRRAPPGFRALSSQTFSWHVEHLTAASQGRLLAVTSDSVHALDFYYPGLRPSAHVFLGPRELKRRQPYALVVHGSELQEVLGERAVDIASRADVSEIVREVLQNNDKSELTYVLSEERWPRVFITPQGGARMPAWKSAVQTRVGELFQEFWITMRGPVRFGSRWWPRPGWNRAIVKPLFGDLDRDGQTDLVWSNLDGALLIQCVASSQPQSFQGFGDVKALQPGDAESAPVLWLTDPVWDGQPDRLHAAQIAGDDLQVLWSSEDFETTLVALASADLNSDGAYDLVVAEGLPEATRLHIFLALPGELTAARGGPWKESEGERR